ncbi:MAG: NAD(P)/FAD-dependent oxidoreductase [Actinobacteria bacterium]|nr:MAG: NAD(P)/FAD-dependent oxidoreductase [Actinomycetota bacterium]
MVYGDNHNTTVYHREARVAENTDVLVIGAGTAGNAAARALARAGRRVIVAEPDRVGGTCLWRGCMPKKALYHAAAVVRGSARAEQFGISAGAARIDWPAVLAWKWHAQETYAGDQDGILASLGIERIRASARFVSPDEVVVGDRTVRAEHVVVSTGAVPVTLDVPGSHLAETSDAALRYPTLPASLCIIGGGYIALEFAGIYASFGTKVTVLSRGQELLAPFDRDCVALARTALESLGVMFVTSAAVESLAGAPGDITISYDVGGTRASLKAERVLSAIGRRPAYDGLDLDVAGVALDARGNAILDHSLRTTNPRVYVAGDAAAREQHTPIANIHGRAIAQSILSGQPLAPDVAGTPFTCFTVPELAQTGLTLEAAERDGIDAEVHSATFEYLGAAIISDVRHGLVKIIAEKDTGIVVGAHVAGERASDLIYPLALAVRTRRTLGEVRATAGVHPAFSESVNWAAF